MPPCGTCCHLGASRRPPQASARPEVAEALTSSCPAQRAHRAAASALPIASKDLASLPRAGGEKCPSTTTISAHTAVKSQLDRNRRSSGSTEALSRSEERRVGKD